MVNILFYIATALSCILMILALAFNIMNERKDIDHPVIPNVLVTIVAGIAFLLFISGVVLLPSFPGYPSPVFVLTNIVGAIGLACLILNAKIASGDSLNSVLGMFLFSLTLAYFILIIVYDYSMTHYFLSH